MIITIEGKPASGKTTICIKLIEKLKNEKTYKLCGFITREIRDSGGTRIGFEIVTLQGERAILADIYQKTPFKVGKYFVRVDNIDKSAIAEIEKFLKNECEIIIIDEIGKMEMLSSRFQYVMAKILNYNRGLIICTLPIVDFHPLVNAFRIKSDKRFFLEKGKFNSEVVAEEIFRTIQKQRIKYKN
ncbi:MAG: nucleoside-triphosphatase [bacterium]|nr:nucleoside-triphosphatase [bacterium]